MVDSFVVAHLDGMFGLCFTLDRTMLLGLASVTEHVLMLLLQLVAAGLPRVVGQPCGGSRRQVGDGSARPDGRL